MADRASPFKRIQIAGLAAILVGVVLLGTAAVGSASSSTGETGCQHPRCSLTVDPSDNPFTNASPAQVYGKHFTPGARGVVVECNMDPSAPTIAVDADKEKLGALSVGCSFYLRTPVKVTRRGTLFAGLEVTAGVIGPPTAGTDSSGGSAAADATSYPCPPTQGQVEEGVSCALVFQDEKKTTHEFAYADITFTPPFTTTTTTTTTTTNPGCSQLASSVSSGAASVTVTPATCLVEGTTVTITGSGLNRVDLGSIMECNTAPGEPTAWNTEVDASIPVGCTDPADNFFSTNSSGVLGPPAQLKGGVATGTVGPPFTAGSDEGTPPAGTPAVDLPSDSNAQAIIDAPEYPCPPTPAQASVGVTCAVVVNDLAPPGANADLFVVPVTFDSHVTP